MDHWHALRDRHAIVGDVLSISCIAIAFPTHVVRVRLWLAPCSLCIRWHCWYGIQVPLTVPYKLLFPCVGSGPLGSRAAASPVSCLVSLHSFCYAVCEHPRQNVSWNRQVNWDVLSVL